MSPFVRIISSMATKHLLAELVEIYLARSKQGVIVESVGGVDAVRRVERSEPFDVAILSSTAIDALVKSGHALPQTATALARSGVAVAIRAGSPPVPIHDEEALRLAVLAAPSISYSTGPSGVHLAKVFERWGVADTIRSRIVQAPPGVPVGSLVAKGDVALGFQQFSELMHIEGITVLGPLPATVQTVTVFSGAVLSVAAQPDAAHAWLRFLASDEASKAKRRHGMEPA